MKTSQTVLKTRIQGLDFALNGGIPKGSTILFSGPAGMGKTILALQLSYNITKEGGIVGYLSTEQRVEDLFSQARTFGWNLEQYKKTNFIVSDNLPKIQASMDIFSAPDVEWDYFDVGPDDTKSLDSWTSWFNEELEKRELEKYDLIIIDSINPFIDDKGKSELERSTREVITRFFSTLADNQCTSMLLITNLALPEIESFVDGVIEVKNENLSLFEIQKMMRIKGFRKIKHETNWIPYVISETRGLIIHPPIPLKEFYVMDDDATNSHGILATITGHEHFENPTERMLFPFSACLNTTEKGRILVEVNGHHEIRPYLYFVSRQAEKLQVSTLILHQSNIQVILPQKIMNNHSTNHLTIQAIDSLANKFVTVKRMQTLDQLSKQLASLNKNTLTIIADFENLLLQHLAHDERRRILMEFFHQPEHPLAKNTLQLYFVNQHVLEPHEMALLEHFMDDVLRIQRSNATSILTVKKSLLPPKNHTLHLKWD